MTMLTHLIRSSIALGLVLTFSLPTWAEDATSAPEAEITADTSLESEATEAVETTDTKELFKENLPDSYVVEKGDTLWGISSYFLKDPWMWPEIWHVNPQIANPHLIYPGDTIKLIYLEGGPRLTVKRGDAGMTYKLSPTDGMSGVGGNGSQMNANGDQKLSPSIRIMPLEAAIPAIPLDIIDPFLSSSRIVEPGRLESSPYVLQGSQRHIIAGAGSELYARGSFDPKDKIYGFFRKGKVYIDPKTQEVLGVQAIHTGVGKINNVEGDIGRFSIVESETGISLGDRLLINEEQRVEPTFFPSPPDMDLHGEIIDVEGGVSQIGAMDVVVINRGERDELRSGNVLAIYQAGEVVRDPIHPNESVRLPDERAGLVMIFTTFEKLSYALVLQADRPLAVGDKVRKP